MTLPIKKKPAPKPRSKPKAKPKAKAKPKPRAKKAAGPAVPEPILLTAPMGGGRERLDKVLAAALEERGLTRSRIQNLLTEGSVRVDGELRPARFSLKGGEQIVVQMQAPRSMDLVATRIPLKVLYEDKDLLVINKQAGLVTHPGAGHFDDTLANALLHHCGKSLQPIHGSIRPGIVHRLDKDTTGCMVAAKSEPAFIKLQQMIAAREVTRIYLAMVWGDLREDSGTIDAALGRGGDRKKMTLRSSGGKPAVTHFKVKDRFPDACELECRLETGRTHQIRAHLLGIKHPVVGDSSYGRIPGHLKPELREALEAVLHRQALHAWRLQFKHPITGKMIKVEAPEPADYAAARKLLKASA